MELARSIVLPETEHTHTIIFLHGRGDTAQNFAESFFWSRDSFKRSLKDVFPSVRWVFPQAEILFCERQDQDWSQWFDIWNTLDFSEREELQAPGLCESVKSVMRLIHQEVRTVGGLDKVVLAGISQGGATAMHTLLHLTAPDTPSTAPSDKSSKSQSVSEVVLPSRPSKPLSLAGFMGFSCRLPFPGGTLAETREVLALGGSPSDEILRNTPVFLGHCADDPVVFVEYGRQLRDALEGFGMQGVWREYPQGGHWLNAPQGIDDVVIFLKAQGLPEAVA